MPRIFIRRHQFTPCIEFCNGKDWKNPISHALLDVFAVDNDMIWMTRSIDSGRIRINIWRQCNWHTWLHSSGGDGIRDTDIYFSSPHRTFPFTRIIFLLAKHICQLPALSMRAWEKTNTIFCWEWFENANRKKLDIFTREQMSQLFICRSPFSQPKTASGQMFPMLKILIVS